MADTAERLRWIFRDCLLQDWMHLRNRQKDQSVYCWYTRKADGPLCVFDDDPSKSGCCFYLLVCLKCAAVPEHWQWQRQLYMTWY